MITMIHGVSMTDKKHQRLYYFVFFVGIFVITSIFLGNITGAKQCFSFLIVNLEDCNTAEFFHYFIMKLIIPFFVGSFVAGMVFRNVKFRGMRCS